MEVELVKEQESHTRAVASWGSGEGTKAPTRFWAPLGFKGGALYLIFCHSHSHSPNDIGNVYLLFLSKAKG